VHGEPFLEGVDHRVALLPDCFRHEVVDAHHQHVLVMRAVEDDHLALGGSVHIHAPQKSCAASSRDGALKPCTCVPCGFIAPAHG